MNAITTRRDLVVRDVDGEPRIFDLDLAARLGFAQPIDIRKLIRRHRGALEKLGTVATVATVIRGQKAQEFYLNRRQALFITAKSGTETATEITVEVVRRFDEYEHGGRPGPAINVRDPQQLNTIATQLLEVRQELQQRAELAEQKVAELEPAALAFGRVRETNELLSYTEAAQLLGVPRTWFINTFLMWRVRWIYRTVDSPEKRPLPRHDVHKAKLMDFREKEKALEDGSFRLYKQGVITDKGKLELELLIELYLITTGFTRTSLAHDEPSVVPAEWPVSGKAGPHVTMSIARKLLDRGASQQECSQ
jgi:phage regulator Rha-like protein